MQKMSTSNVLFVGLKGLGIEIAKNTALAGVKSIVLHDPSIIKKTDLSSHFFLKDSDIGKIIDIISAPLLGELNEYVPVSVFGKVLDAESIKPFQVVVLSGSDHKTRLYISELCRAASIKFICAATSGLFALTFVDLLPGFIVQDDNGEVAKSGMVSSVSKDADGVVCTIEEVRHGLQDGEWVSFSEVQGMTELNSIEPRKVVVTGPYTFKIGDTSTLSEYKTGGYFHQIKKPMTVDFKSFSESLRDPEFLISDFAKFDRPIQLHVCFQALDVFKERKGDLPESYSKTDAQMFIEICKEIMATVKEPVEVDTKLVEMFSFQARGDVPAMNAVIGGLIAQEVLKALSGKFTPLKQFLYFDSLESLPKNCTINQINTKSTGSRYDAQVAVFGQEFMEKVRNARQFLVGAGAIGCEMLKNWAMMGLGSGKDGSVIITDMDTIEKSNLNRQFLFRSWDVSKLKSQCAVSAVEKMNPDMVGKISFFADRVGPETENIFGDRFFQNLTGVTNALDNVEARKYMDRRCVFYGKPLLESGTLGTKGNTQVVIPHLTESYSSSNDPPEKSIPICTLKNFPNAIEHTIQWGRDLFEGLFVVPAGNVNLYLSQNNYIESLMKQGGNHNETISSILAFLVTEKPLSFEECIVWARLKFEELFSSTIKQLLYNFPKDQLTSNGLPFWSGPKRAPDAAVFNADNKLHMDFIVATANLHAFNYGLKGEKDLSVFKKVLNTVIIPEFTPKAGVKIAVVEAEAAQQGSGMADDTEVEKNIKALPPPSTFAGLRMVPAEFEKDDPTNFHIDFVTAASNLRASNYSIAPADHYQTKFIAGKIIPAIATTTALVTGLVCLELYKIIDERKVLEDYKNGFINLSLPFFAFSEPIAAQKYKYHSVEWTLWDRFNLEGDMTLKELVSLFKQKHELEITMMSCGQTMLYSFFMPAKKLTDRMEMKISAILESISKKPIEAHVTNLFLEVCVNDKEGEDVEVPPICIALLN